MPEILAGRNAIAVLPTGGGKSVCYQIPALLRPGVGVVISPLIALMSDQAEALKQFGVAAARMDSALSVGEREETRARLAPAAPPGAAPPGAGSSCSWFTSAPACYRCQ